MPVLMSAVRVDLALTDGQVAGNGVRSDRRAAGIVSGGRLASCPLLELALGLPKGASEVRDLGAAEQQQDDQQDDDDFRRTDVHVRKLPGEAIASARGANHLRADPGCDEVCIKIVAMDVDAYLAVKDRVAQVVSGHGNEPIPACPGWTVRDVVARIDRVR